jgi:tRNA-guanine transglycosylase
MERTHRWAERCVKQHESMKVQERKSKSYERFLFGIVQGGNHRDLREESARSISSMNFDGIAIGGESIGYNMEATKEILDWVYPIIPYDKPHYAMGLGFSPSDLFDVVERGVDMFDCVAPTRMARNGTLFVSPSNGGAAENKFRISISNAQFRNDQGPIDSTCTCTTCQRFSRAYLHHLFAADELLAYTLSSIHNLHFFLSLMSDIRSAIHEDRFLELKKQWV